MQRVVYSKTEAGQREIQTRELRLAPRLRSLLVQVDGKRSVAGLLDMLGAAGITDEHFTQLADAGLIASTAPLAPVSAEPPKPQAETGSLSAQAERLIALYRECNGVIAKALGLKGFLLQLQLEKLAGIDDYRAFSEVLIEAVRKARGDSEAQDVRQRIAALLAG